MKSLLFGHAFTARFARDRRARREETAKVQVKIKFFSALSAISAVKRLF